jgi:hypothetical protein
MDQDQAAAVNPHPIVPTVGRVVYAFDPTRWKGPRPALLTYVGTPGNPGSPVAGVITLCPEQDGDLIHENNGSLHAFMRGVYVYAPGFVPTEQEVPPPYCQWMPYQQQVSQAFGNAGLIRIEEMAQRQDKLETLLGDTREGLMNAEGRLNDFGQDLSKMRTQLGGDSSTGKVPPPSDMPAPVDRAVPVHRAPPPPPEPKGKAAAGR